MLYETFFTKKSFYNYFRLFERIVLNSLHGRQMSFDCKLIVSAFIRKLTVTAF